jgi:hypothetical protein
MPSPSSSHLEEFCEFHPDHVLTGQVITLQLDPQDMAH